MDSSNWGIVWYLCSRHWRLVLLEPNSPECAYLCWKGKVEIPNHIRRETGSVHSTVCISGWLAEEWGSNIFETTSWLTGPEMGKKLQWDHLLGQDSFNLCNPKSVFTMSPRHEDKNAPWMGRGLFGHYYDLTSDIPSLLTLFVLFYLTYFSLFFFTLS